MRKLELHWQILIAIVLAIVAGYFVKSSTSEEFIPNILGVPFVSIFDYIGTMFLNALKMIIVPLITSSIIVGVADTMRILIFRCAFSRMDFVPFNSMHFYVARLQPSA